MKERHTHTHTCWDGLGLHLQADLDQVHGGAQPHGHEPGEGAGHRQVQQAAGLQLVAVAILADQPLGVAEEAEHQGVVDGDAGEGERHALKEPRHLEETRG